MSVRTWGALAASLCGVGFTVDADIGEGEPFRWSEPMDVTVEIVSGSEDVSDSSDLRAIRNAMTSWSALDCSMLALREVSSFGDIAIDFVSTGWNPAFNGALGISSRTRIGPPPTYTSASIEMNDQQFEFSTISEPFTYDMESVAVHELGHALGLEHSQHPAATMNWSVRRGTNYSRSLHPDDINALCYLYPAQPFACVSDADCPLLVRVSNNAQTFCNTSTGLCESGPADYGQPCYAGSQCVTGLCVFDPDVVGAPATVPNPGFCSDTCDSAPCPSGSLCADVSELPMGSTTMPTGEVCIIGRDECVVPSNCPPTLGGNVLCDVDLDGVSRCIVPCYEDDDCSYAPDLFCRGGTGGDPEGRCGRRGPGGEGESCLSPLDCQSLICGGGLAPYSCCEGTRCAILGTLPGTSPDGGGAADGAPPGDSGALPGDSEAAIGDASMGGDPVGGRKGCVSACSPSLLGFSMLLAALWSRRRRNPWDLRGSAQKGIS